MAITRQLKRHKNTLFAAAFVSVLLGGAFMFLVQHRSTFVHNPIVRDLLPAYRALRSVSIDALDLLYIFKMEWRSEEISEYELWVSPEDIKKLNARLPDSRADSVINGKTWLSDEQKKRVPGIFIYEGREYEVEVRYRGDNPNHWLGKKKSWQVVFPKDDLFYGQRVIKLIIPKDRLYFVEALNNYRAEKLGLKPPKTEFASVRVNGDYMGVYYAIEDWDNAYLERQQLPSDANVYKTEDIFIQNNFLAERGGSIFSESRFWDQEAGDGRYSYRNYSEVDMLVDLLEKGELADVAESFVDLESFYNWQVLLALSGSIHPSDEGNVRLYFNNSSGKFEFIPWDVGLDSFSPDQIASASLLTRQLFADERHVYERNKRLYEYLHSDKGFEDDLEYYDELSESLGGMFYADSRKSDSNFAFDSELRSKRNMLNENSARIEELFKSDDSRMAVSVNEDMQQITLRVDVKNFSGLRLDTIEVGDSFNGAQLYRDTNRNNVLDSGDLQVGNLNVEEGVVKVDSEVFLMEFLPEARNPITGSSRHTLFLSYVPKAGRAVIPIDEFEFTFRNALTDKKVSLKDVRYSNSTTFQYFGAAERTLEEFLSLYPMFRKTENGIQLSRGVHLFPRTVIIPRGTRLSVISGTTLLMGEGASFVSYSPVSVIGTPSAPVRVEPQSSSASWGVFSVLNTELEENTLQYFEAHGGGEAYINGVYFSGMVSFYNANLSAEHITVRDTTGEDGLNIKYGTLTLTESTFSNNFSDALDADYSVGSITNSQFIENGNDAIDISGAHLLIAGNEVRGSGDKCVSVGEATESTLIFDNAFLSCPIGVQAKDASRPDIIANYFEGNGVAVNAYRKKPLYVDGGLPEVYGNYFVANGDAHSSDSYSEITEEFNYVEDELTSTKQCSEDVYTLPQKKKKDLEESFLSALSVYNPDYNLEDEQFIGRITCPSQ